MSFVFLMSVKLIDAHLSILIKEKCELFIIHDVDACR